MDKNFYDYELTGRVDDQGNLLVLADQRALTNAIKLWLCSFSSERLYKYHRGGYVLEHLLKPMSEERAKAIEQAITQGLRTDFIPSMNVTNCKVKCDYENSLYDIHLEAFCPGFKANVYTDITLNNIV